MEVVGSTATGDDGGGMGGDDAHQWLEALAAREPFSPGDLGRPLPYLDVLSVQSTRLLSVTRRELDEQRRRHQRPQAPVESRRAGAHGGGNEGSDDDDDEDDEDDDGADGGGPDEARAWVDCGPRPEQLLVEPIQLPSLRHTGVPWRVDAARHQGAPLATGAPNHAADDTQVQLFYSTGAKNANLREYIKETLQRHLAGLDRSTLGATATASAPTLGLSGPTTIVQTKSPSPSKTQPAPAGATAPTSSTKASVTKPTKKKLASPSSHSPKRTGPVSSRLVASMSTSTLLNPELTRQTKEILAQIRANANKISDLIGS